MCKTDAECGGERMSDEVTDYRKLAEALAEALEQRNLWIEGEEYRELVILRMRLSARVDSLSEELKAATARIAELELSSVQIQYMGEDELPKPISYKVYSAMYPCSKVDFVRMFPFVMVDGDKCFLIKLPEVQE